MHIVTILYFAAYAADDEFSRQLVKTFGSRAGDMRYLPAGKGEPGSVLRAAHDAWQATEAARAHAMNGGAK